MKKLLITVTLLLLLSLKPLFAGVAKGVDVREVQTILTEFCFNVGPIDGVWGKKTEKAAEAFFLKYFKKYSGHFGKGEMILLKSYEGHSRYEQCSKSDAANNFKIIIPPISKVSKSFQNKQDFSTDFSSMPSFNRLKETDPEWQALLRNNSEIFNKTLKFTLANEGGQTKSDKTTKAGSQQRKESQRVELRYTQNLPLLRNSIIEFDFKTEEKFQTNNRILISQVKLLVEKKSKEKMPFPQPVISVYAHNGGEVKCMEYNGTKPKKVEKTVNLPDGFLTDGRWHKIKMEYFPGELCRVTIDGKVQIERKTKHNMMPFVRHDKYHMNIGPYRDKTSATQTFYFDNLKISSKLKN